MRRTLIIAVTFAFLALIGVFAVNLSGPPASSVNDPMVGLGAPTLALETLGRETARDRAETAAQPPKLINFWATWCTPCLAEHPLLMQLADAGIEISGVAYRDNPERIEAFLKRHGDPFTTVYLDPDGEAMLDFGNSGVPETYVISGDGVILAHVQGPLDPTNFREVILPALIPES